MIPVFPTAYFGNVDYFKAIFEHKNVTIEAKEYFIKQTYRNRCEILTSNGVQALSVPVIRKNGSKTVIEDIEISYDTDWRKDHWKAIESAYSSSPYFEHYGIEVKELIYQKESNLLKFNQNILTRIFSWLDISTEINFTNEYGTQLEIIDYRNDLNLVKKDQQSFRKYIQVFGDFGSFTPNLSIIDAIFCQGPMARTILEK